MSLVDDTIASLKLQLDACQALLEDERTAHEETRRAKCFWCGLVQPRPDEAKH